MKKILLLVTLFISTLLITGCSKDKDLNHDVESTNEYTINYNLNGGFFKETPIFNFTKNSYIKVPDVKIASLGFLGWYTESNFINEIKYIDGSLYDSDLNLYAKYTNSDYYSNSQYSYYRKSTDSIEIIEVNGLTTSIQIQDNITSIKKDAFSPSFFRLTNVEVSDSNRYFKEMDGNLYTKDGKTLLYYANKNDLSNIVVPGGVTKIGAYAFNNQTYLESIILPSSVEIIEDGAFAHCRNLTKVEIPKNVTKLGVGLFEGCSKVNQFTVSNENEHFKSIDSNLYTKDGKILIEYISSKKSSEIEYSTNLEEIGAYAFSNKKIVDIVIPNTVKTIGSAAFKNNTSLEDKNVVIPNTVEVIAEKVFYNTNIETITLSNNLKSLSEQAFSNSSLKNITIPSSVTYLGSLLFKNTSKLTSITVEEGNKLYKSIEGNLYTKDGKTILQAANFTNGLNSILNEVTTIGSGAFSTNGLISENVVIPNNIQIIESYALSHENIQSIKIPNSVVSIQSYAFADTSIQTITIPGSVSTISYATFEDCEQLKSIYLESNVKKIESYAFNECRSLQEVNLSDTLESIDTYAFYLCTNLEDIIIPKSVTYMGYEVFAGCFNLTIYCEIEAQPSTWHTKWVDYFTLVQWGYKN